MLPSNEGRGYVLRKIMRRAMRNARLIGTEDPYLYKLTGFVAELMRDAYPEMMESIQRVARVVKDEEHRYATTFLVAEKVFNDEVKAAAAAVLPGAVVVQAVRHLRPGARRAGRDGARARLGHRPRRLRRGDGAAADTRARQLEGRGKGRGGPGLSGAAGAGPHRIPGYSELESTSRVIGLLLRSSWSTVPAGATAKLVFDQTPFYAETGGQVGDTRRAAVAGSGEQRRRSSKHVLPGVPGLCVHRVMTARADPKVGDVLRAEVAAPLRDSTLRNHTATHLLHAALRQVLGTHVKQAGSVVEPAACASISRITRRWITRNWKKSSG